MSRTLSWELFLDGLLNLRLVDPGGVRIGLLTTQLGTCFVQL